MMKRTNLIFLILLPLVAFGQFKPLDEPISISTLLNTTAKLGSSTMGILGLDPSQLDIQHSYQMGYSSFGGQGITQSTYLNTLTYHFKMPLTVSFQWGISHQPFGNNENLSMLQSGPFVSGARLRYEPTKNMVIDLEYRQIPYGSYYYNRFDRW